MVAAVDLASFHSMTGGDEELERLLFQEFYDAAEKHLLALAESSNNGQNETWRATAYALKGMAYSLGAQRMGDLCKRAQEIDDAAGSGKKALLTTIRVEYGRVQQFLHGVYG